VDRRALGLLGIAAATVLTVAVVRPDQRVPASASPPAAVLVSSEVETLTLELPPLRDYAPIDISDVAPARPPFVELKGFPPPAPAPRVSSGPIRRFLMPRFELDQALEVLNMTPAGELPTPLDASYRVGWYADFGQPGAGGNAVFTAHETWNHQQAPFFNLHRAGAGDEVILVMADGRRLVYAVFSNTRYDATTIPMNEIVWPAHKDGEWITLITCGGRIVYDRTTGFGEYLDRDVVVARRVS
jgi:hypothetical protein